MSAISLRLPDDIKRRLDAESNASGVTRSDLARTAITEFLQRRERERFMRQLLTEAQTAYADPATRAAAQEWVDLAFADDVSHWGADEEAGAGGVWWR
jgi:predicted transcriptional regulator